MKPYAGISGQSTFGHEVLSYLNELHSMTIAANTSYVGAGEQTLKSRHHVRGGGICIPGWRYFVFAVLEMIILASTAKAVDSAEIPVPTSAIGLAAVDLRAAPRMIYKTADTIFVVRNDCDASTTIHIDQYSITNFENRPIDIPQCARFGGNVISALGADAANIYIKFGVDRQVHGPTDNDDSKTHNVVVIDRSSKKEVAFGRIADWIDLVDASGPDIVACQCVGTGEVSPNLKCLSALRPISRAIQFMPGRLSGPVACVGGAHAVAAARIFVGETAGETVAVNEKYAIVKGGILPIAAFTVEEHERMLNLALPPGYEFAALGTHGTAELAAVSKRTGQVIEISLLNIATEKLSQVMNVPIPKGEPMELRIHLYERWLVVAYGDAIYIYEVQSGREVYFFNTPNHSWIFAADLYGHFLYVRSVPFGEGSDKELPALQIDFDQLKTVRINAQTGRQLTWMATMMNSSFSQASMKSTNMLNGRGDK